MARVPLYNGGVPPPAPVGARVPLPAALPVGSDGQAWGQALSNVSGTLQTLALKKAEADDTRQLVEAEGEMRRHAMEFQQFQQTTTDQDQWLPEWQKRQTGMQKYIDGLKLTDSARIRLKSSFGRWSDGHAIAIQGEAFKQSVGRARMAVFTRGEEAAKSGDLNGAYNALSMLPENAAWPEEIKAKKADYERMAKDANLRAENDAANAFLLQEQPDLESAVAVFENSTLMSKDEKTIAKAKATHFYTQKVETQKNKASAALYGKLNYDAANGIFPSADEINWQVAEGQMTVEDATPIMSAIKRRDAGLPADPAKFNDFINNRVLTYDPTKDTTGAEFEKIQREAAAMGVDQFQAQRFTSNIDAVVKRNTTSAGRSESAKRKWMLDGVQELMKSGAFGEYKTRSEEPAAQSLLQMPGKLQQFGLKAHEAERVAKTTGPQQLELFQEFAKNRYKTDKNTRTALFDQAQYDLLEEGEKELFNQALSGKFGGGEVIVGKALEASLKAAELNDRVESAFDEFLQTHKRTPTQKEAVQMFHDITGSERRQSAWFPQIVPDQASSAGPSIRGFSEAPDLADKLPEGLAPYAADFEEAARKYNLSPKALAAIAMHETGNGTSKAFRNKKNAMGVSNSSGPIAFDNVRDSIFAQAKSLAGNLYKGADTFDAIGRIYAPIGAENDPTSVNSYWPGGVASHFAKLQ